eukprot:6535581-Prymnesium_polylepis.1
MPPAPRPPGCCGEPDEDRTAELKPSLELTTAGLPTRDRRFGAGALPCSFATAGMLPAPRLLGRCKKPDADRTVELTPSLELTTAGLPTQDRRHEVATFFRAGAQRQTFV